jgi:hypothetical protein
MYRSNNRRSDVGKGRGIVLFDVLFLLCGIGLLLGAIGVVVWVTLPSMEEAQASKQWNAVPGRIVHSRVEVSYDSDHERQETAFVQYLYTVDGIDLIGDRVAIGMNFDDANDVTRRYPVDREVEVFVDSVKPWATTLEPGVRFSVLMFFPLVMFLLGIPFTLLPLHSLRKARGGSADVQRNIPPRFGGCLMAIGGVVSVFGIGIGVFLYSMFGAAAIKHAQGEGWTTTPGTVTESRFEKSEAEPHDWVGHIEFEYHVAGKVHRAATFRYDVLAVALPGAEAVYLNRPGDEVDVFLSETEPDSAFLEIASPAETASYAALFFLVPVGICLFAVTLLIQGFIILRRGTS